VNSCEIEIPASCGLVIFGASGDLAKRKLIPSLYHLFFSRMLPERFFILGTGREVMTTERFREVMLAAVKAALPGDSSPGDWPAFSERLHYTTLDYRDRAAYVGGLRYQLPELERAYQMKKNRIF
jgi:glucose-6-phosphate 1-dehydrogenase